MSGLADGRFLQVESITFSWCDSAKALAYIQAALAGQYDANDFAVLVRPTLDPPGQHGHCRSFG